MKILDLVPTFSEVQLEALLQENHFEVEVADVDGFIIRGEMVIFSCALSDYDGEHEGISVAVWLEGEDEIRAEYVEE